MYILVILAQDGLREQIVFYVFCHCIASHWCFSVSDQLSSAHAYNCWYSV